MGYLPRNLIYFTNIYWESACMRQKGRPLHFRYEAHHELVKSTGKSAVQLSIMPNTLHSRWRCGGTPPTTWRSSSWTWAAEKMAGAPPRPSSRGCYRACSSDGLLPHRERPCGSGAGGRRPVRAAAGCSRLTGCAGSGQGSQQMCSGARTAFCSDDAVVTLRARGDAKVLLRCDSFAEMAARGT